MLAKAAAAQQRTKAHRKHGENMAAKPWRFESENGAPAAAKTSGASSEMAARIEENGFGARWLQHQ